MAITEKDLRVGNILCWTHGGLRPAFLILSIREEKIGDWETYCYSFVTGEKITRYFWTEDFHAYDLFAGVDDPRCSENT